MSQVTDANQFSALQSPMDDGKDNGLRSRFGKDDLKEQAYQAREFVKTKALDLKEQVVKEGVGTTVQASLQPAIDAVREKVGLNKAIDGEIDHSDDQVAGDWEEVKRKGNHKVKNAAHLIDQKLDENLTQEQRAKLNKAGLKAKKGAMGTKGRAVGWTNRMLDIGLVNPRLRPMKSWIQRNNLQLPAVILGSLLTLWLGLSVIRLVTSTLTPSVPAFDIHSADASSAWLKYHAGEYKGKALDMKQSLTDRAATFLANHDYDSLRSKAIDYRDIGMSKLGLQEPTWGEWAWAKVTGRPITWQERVDHVVDLTKRGLYRPDILTKLGLRHEPTLGDRLKANLPSVPSFHAQPTYLESIRSLVWDGIESIRESLPGGAELRAARLRAMAAAHPSTIDNIKSTANYVKNRIVHGSQEAAHIAQDRANELVDKAKHKVGL